MVLASTFRSMIHSEFIFVNGVRQESSFTMSHVYIQHHLLKILFFPIEMPCYPFQKAIVHKGMDLFLDFQLFHCSVFLSLFEQHTLLDYSSFVLNFEIRKCESSNFVLLFQEYTLVPLHFH